MELPEPRSHTSSSPRIVPVDTQSHYGTNFWALYFGPGKIPPPKTVSSASNNTLTFTPITLSAPFLPLFPRCHLINQFPVHFPLSVLLISFLLYFLPFYLVLFQKCVSQLLLVDFLSPQGSRVLKQIKIESSTSALELQIYLQNAIYLLKLGVADPHRKKGDAEPGKILMRIRIHAFT